MNKKVQILILSVLSILLCVIHFSRKAENTKLKSKLLDLSRSENEMPVARRDSHGLDGRREVPSRLSSSELINSVLHLSRQPLNAETLIRIDAHGPNDLSSMNWHRLFFYLINRDEQEIIALLEGLKTSNTPEWHRGNLLSQILRVFPELENPKNIVERYLKTGTDGMQIRRAFGKWIKKSPAEARAWLDQRLEDGSLISKGLDQHAESALLQAVTFSLLKNSPTEALSYFEQIPIGYQNGVAGSLVRQLLGSSPPEDTVALLNNLDKGRFRSETIRNLTNYYAKHHPPDDVLSQLQKSGMDEKEQKFALYILASRQESFQKKSFQEQVDWVVRNGAEFNLPYYASAIVQSNFKNRRDELLKWVERQPDLRVKDAALKSLAFQVSLYDRDILGGAQHALAISNKETQTKALKDIYRSVSEKKSRNSLDEALKKSGLNPEDYQTKREQ